MNTELGYLHKKRKVKIKDDEYEVYELLDVVFGFSFINSEHNQIFHIISGKYTGEYASVFDKNGNNDDEIVVTKSIEEAIKENDNHVDLIAIRKKMLKQTSKYYMKNKYGDLSKIINDDLIKFLEQEKAKENKSFDKDIFEKESNISNMYNTIKKTIISQDEQIMEILTALFKNQKVVSSNFDEDLIRKLKENVLIYGSTGTGKTEILRRISKIYKIPIVIEDATSLSETGYHGRDVTDMLDDLYIASGENMNLAERGIIVIDEFDKLAESKKDQQSHVSRLGVQRSLLKLLDGETFYFNNKKFNASKLTIVCLGAFTGITNKDDYHNLQVKDFTDYGIMRELIGRFSKRIAMNPLSKKDIIKILTDSDFSPLNTYDKLFKSMGVNFEYSKEFVEWVADQAITLESGARSLKTVVDDCISGALFRIFAGEYSKITLVKPTEENNQAYNLEKGKNKFFGSRKNKKKN